MKGKFWRGLIAVAAAAAMTFGVSAPAFADDATATYDDMSTVTITKSYELAGTGISPEETFYVTQTDSKVTDGDAKEAPKLTSISPLTFERGAAGDANKKTGQFTVTLPTYTKTGKYEYTLKETVGKTAGVTYRTKDIKLVVTVIEQNGLVRVAAVHCEDEGGAKTSSFADNTYSAGTLNVSKTVAGNLGDKTKEFQFTVKFAAPEGKDWTRDITVTGGASNLTWDGNTATFTLSDGDNASFANVPAGVTYTVDETDYSGDGYSTTGEVTSPTAMTKDGANVNVTNTKTGTVDTGVLLNNAPYIAILGGAVVAGIYFVNRKKHEDMD